MGMNRVKIILAYKNNRQLLQCGKIQTFVKDSLVCRPVSEEADHNSVLSLQLYSVRITDRVWNRRSHHGGSAHNPVSRIDQMHGAALTFGAACSLSIKLGEHFLEFASLCQVIGMAPVRTENYIVWLQSFANSNGDCFLSDGKMHRALDLVAGIDLGNFLLHPPNSVEGPVKTLVYIFIHAGWSYRETNGRFLPNPAEGKLLVATPSPRVHWNQAPSKAYRPVLSDRIVTDPRSRPLFGSARQYSQSMSPTHFPHLWESDRFRLSF